METQVNQEIWHDAKRQAALAVLCSGGVDSALLLAEAVTQFPAVYPVYIRTGSVWEDTELEFLGRFLSAVAAPNLKALTILDQPVVDLYGAHWSMTGQGVPDQDSPDSAVYLPGRNVLLLAKPLIWCHLHQIPQIAMALLAANPFPDATPEFFGAYSGAVSMAVGGCVRVLRPYAKLGKTVVLARGMNVPLQHTFSCIRPKGAIHCGECNKCAERQRAFVAAKLIDPTPYHLKSESMNAPGS